MLCPPERSKPWSAAPWIVKPWLGVSALKSMSPSRSTVESVVAVPAEQRVPAVAAMQPVVAALAIQRVVAASTADHVGPEVASS